MFYFNFVLWRENWTCGAYFACNKELLNTQKALGSGTFDCRTMQHAAFLLSLTKSWSIEDTDFDPEDDIQLVRVPTIDFDSDDDDPLAD